jgi:hypothetical protein
MGVGPSTAAREALLIGGVYWLAFALDDGVFYLEGRFGAGDCLIKSEGRSFLFGSFLALALSWD